MPHRRPPLAVTAAVVLLAIAACRPHRAARDAAPPRADTGPAPAPRSPAPPRVRVVYPDAPRSFARLAARVARSLVSLRTDGPVRDGPIAALPAGPGAFAARGPDRERLGRALGTGFVIDARGFILTSHRVAAAGRKLWARLPGGPELPARVVGRDPDSDVALLAVALPAGVRPPPARTGDPGALLPGAWVAAVGNPFGAGHVVSAGVLAARPGPDTPLAAARGAFGLLWTDARGDAITAGGPLVNSAGEVVGLSLPPPPGAEAGSRGVALPIDVALRVAAILRRHGRVARAWLGVYIDTPDPAALKRAGLSDRRGALVTRVVTGGPAAVAGIRAGDIIVSFAGEPVRRAGDLPWMAAAAGPGKAVPLRVRRGGGALTFTLRPAPRPE